MRTPPFHYLGNFANREIKVEKKYIAFANGSNGNSSLETRDNAIKWAADIMSKQTSLSRAYLCEVTDVIERKTPPIEVRPFVLPTQEVAKAA